MVKSLTNHHSLIAYCTTTMIFLKHSMVEQYRRRNKLECTFRSSWRYCNVIHATTCIYSLWKYTVDKWRCDWSCSCMIIVTSICKSEWYAQPWYHTLCIMLTSSFVPCFSSGHGIRIVSGIYTAVKSIYIANLDVHMHLSIIMQI